MTTAAAAPHSFFMRLARWRPGRVRGGAAILLYHRIAEPDVDPWGLAVSPTHLDAHLAVISRRATVLSLFDLVSRTESGTIPRRAVTVTFDDGYVDNLLAAKPLLDRHGVPGTVFVTTGPLSTHREFWWDELQAVFLDAGTLPPMLQLDIDGQTHRWTLEEAAPDATARPPQTGWRTWQPPPTRRHAVFVEVWRLLQSLRDAPRRAALDSLAMWAGRRPAVRQSRRTLSPADLTRLARGGLVAIGAHTVTHARLSALSEGEQRTELSVSRQQLEDIVGTPVTTMSYPFGGRADYTPETVAMAREEGFCCACAAFPGLIRAADDLFQLPRFQVADLDGDRFEQTLDRWLAAA